MKENKLIAVLAAGYFLGCALFAFAQTNYADGITVGSTGSYGISSAGVVTASSVTGAITSTGSNTFTTATITNAVISNDAVTTLTVGSGTAIAKILYGSGTVASGATTATITLTGTTAASYAWGTITNNTTNDCYIEHLIPGTNSLSVEVNTDPGASGATIDVLVIR